MHAFILAGGFATRLWPLTGKRPKPLLPLKGKPIVSLLLDGIPSDIPVTVSTNAAFAEDFRVWIKGLERHDVDLVVEGTLKDDHKLGALGALAQWVEMQRIDDDILVLTGDNYLGFSLSRFLEKFHGNALVAAHDIGDLERAKAFGTVIVQHPHPLPPPPFAGEGEQKLNNTHLPPPRRGEGLGVGVWEVTAFEEKPREPKSTLVSAGCAVLPKSTLPVLLEYAKIHPDNVGGIFEEFLRRGLPVDCFTFTEPWMDIGAFHSYLDAHRTLVGNHSIVSPSSHLDRSACEGSVTVAAGCRIERSELKDCMVFNDCTIQDCTLRDCVIDQGCVLKGIDLKGKMLRAGTRLIVE